MRIFHFLDDACMSPWYRAIVPGRDLERRGHQVAAEPSLGDAQMNWAEVLLFHDTHNPGALGAIAHANSVGKLTVCDITDDFWQPHPARAPLWGNDAQAVEAIVRACDLVTTSSEYLRERLSRLNPNVVHMPDALPDDLWPFSVGPSLDSTIIGWHEPSPGQHDFALIQEIVPQLVPKFGDFDFIFFGPPYLPFAMGVSDADLLLRSRMRVLPLSEDPTVVINIVSRFNIGIAAAESPVAGRALSDIHVLEYAACGIPCVASKVDGFAKTSALLARNAKDWLRLLSRLLAEPEYRLGVGEDALRWAKTRVVSKSTWEETLAAAIRRTGKPIAT